jgi:outer membrane protein TolC
MNRWKVVLIGLALTITLAVGCRQQVFLHECDLPHYADIGAPAGIACKPEPPAPKGDVPTPMSVDFPERPARYMTLTEAIAIALERGTTGITSVRFLTQPFSNGVGLAANDDLVNFTGAPQLVQGTDSIRVLALEPAVVGAEIEASLSRFDAVWQTALGFSTIDQPNQGFGAFRNGQFTDFTTTLAKPLASGGLAQILFGAGPATNGDFYSKLNQTPAGTTTLNPAYTPNLQFSFTQPLLQAFGVDINELRSVHPTGGNLYQGPLQTQGVLITRLRFDLSRAEFQRNVNFMLANVETSYWQLFGAYYFLYSREQALRQALEAWRLSRAQFRAGKINRAQYETVLAQYEDFRAQRIQALGSVLERERTLRSLLGMPVEDGTRLVPLDTPTLAPYKPDWDTAVNETLSLRPELIIAREDLKVRQLDLIRERNNLLPDLRLNGGYNIHGIGQDLTGSGVLAPNANGETLPNNALRSLASTHFTDWNVGLTLNMPIGYRNAHASIRQARLRLAEGYLQLRDNEDKATRFLALAYRTILEQYNTIQARRAEREAYALELQTLYDLVRAGKITPSDRANGDSLLDAQRLWADALRLETEAIVNYNDALTAFEFAKGTIMQHDNVVISEGALPHCAQVRAVDHERERAKAILCKERARPDAYPFCVAGPEGAGHGPAHQPLPSLASVLPDKLTAPEGPREELHPARTDETRRFPSGPPLALPELGKPATVPASLPVPTRTAPASFPAPTVAAPVLPSQAPAARPVGQPLTNSAAGRPPATPVGGRPAVVSFDDEPARATVMTFTKEAGMVPAGRNP